MQGLGVGNGAGMFSKLEGPIYSGAGFDSRTFSKLGGQTKMAPILYCVIFAESWGAKWLILKSWPGGQGFDVL